jgi:hypothetical protein
MFYSLMKTWEMLLINICEDVIENIPNQIRNIDIENDAFITKTKMNEGVLKNIRKKFIKYKEYIENNCIQKTLGGRNGKSFCINKSSNNDINTFYKNELKEIVLQNINKYYTNINTLIIPPKNDVARCMIIIYDRPIDRIGYHYDNNYYKKCRFITVLLPLYVENDTSLFTYKRGNEIINVHLNVGELLIFEGDKIYHKASLNKTYNKRIVLSCIYLIPVDIHYNSKLRQNDFFMKIKITRFFEII